MFHWYKWLHLPSIFGYVWMDKDPVIVRVEFLWVYSLSNVFLELYEPQQYVVGDYWLDNRNPAIF